LVLWRFRQVSLYSENKCRKTNNSSLYHKKNLDIGRIQSYTVDEIYNLKNNEHFLYYDMSVKFKVVLHIKKIIVEIYVYWYSVYKKEN
jgi:hypothetical protein